jgi:TonB family protein
MKRCPRCDRTYPDSEKFCETDGSALIAGGPAFVEGSGAASNPGTAGPESVVECPMCGGRAEPGEIICNFCGSRLAPEGEAGYTPPPKPAREPDLGRAGTTISSEPPPRTSVQYTGRMPTGQVEEEDSGGGFLSAIGYLLAALAALAGGAWLAIYLSSNRGTHEEAKAPPAAAVSPAAAAAPVPSVPAVALAASMPVQVTGESASAPERGVEAVKKLFGDNAAALLDAYKQALAGDVSMKDGMLMRVRVTPDGSVSMASVVTSTAPNPGLDAVVIKNVSGWKFAPFSGGAVEVDYPVIFSHGGQEQTAVEADLKTKVAALSPAEAPEYASSPAAPPTPAVAAEPSPAPPRAEASPKPRPRREAARPRPTPSLYDRVADALNRSPKLRRVKAYTNSGGTVTLVGQVFDDNDKMLAERTARSVPGVTSVVDTLVTDTSVWAQRQAQIQQQLQNAGLDKVTVKVIGKDAFLGGEVKTDLERERAATIATSAAPVVVRENLIRVVPGSMFGF